MSDLPLPPRNRLGGSSRLWTIEPLSPRDFACEIMGEPVGRPILSEILAMPAELWVDRPELDRAGPDEWWLGAPEEVVDGAQPLPVFDGKDAAERALLERLVERSGRDADDLVLHSLRVGALAEAIARELGADEDTATMLRRAAVLHDVGKLAVPEEILLNPGCLTPAELELSKLHAAAGAHLLEAGSTPVLRLARMLALHHHERWNGSGYPAALVGDATPLPARIVAVADVFDALTHERAYKAAWSQEEAAVELGRQRGSLHDARVIDALFRVLALLRVRVPVIHQGEAAA